MKTVCIYHSVDLDGWMSAAIVKYWFNKKYPKADSISDLNEDSHAILPPDEISTGESLSFLGWNYGDPIPDLLEYDKVIMCDISFPAEIMFELYTDKGVNFIWIDHHISAIKAVRERLGADLISGITNDKFAACELTWKYFFPDDEMPEIVRLLGRYDCFGHKGTDEEKHVLKFQYGARQVISNYEEAYYRLIDSIETPPKDLNIPTIESRIIEQGESIYEYLCTEAKQVYKNGFVIRLTEILYDDSDIANAKQRQKFICFNKERFNPINFGIDYHKDGYDGVACFWYDGEQWSFSLYNGNEEIDCSVIAKQYGGGGHKGAAGFAVDNIENFLKANK